MSNWQSSYQFSANPQGDPSTSGGSNPVNSESSSFIDDQYPDSLGGNVLSIALIGPDEDRRKAAATALAGCQGGEIREFSTYPPSLDDVPRLLEQNYDVIIIDLDSHPEYALELVESICANGSATVMVYSMKADSELLVRCMRAGAREFLTLPFAQSTMAEALVRASARRPTARLPKKTGGRLLVFLGAKGGDGVTTLACNFAVSLAQETGQSTLLIDLDLPLGDAALNLGVVAEYSTINALQNSNRLDSSFLSRLLVKHSSGVSVLAAPGKFPQYEASNDAIDRLITVARQDFENVVIDMGSRLDLMSTSLFKDGSTVYLVLEAGIAGLRNANRLISQYFSTTVPKLEIVLNRFDSRTGVSEDQITKALTRPAQWKIPNDYNAVRRMQTTAIPLALEDSPISRLIRQMARTICGLPATPEKKGGFSLKSFSRGFSSKAPASGDSRALTQLGLDTDRDIVAAKPEAPAKAPSKPAHAAQTPSAGAAPAAAAQKPVTPAAKTSAKEERTDAGVAKQVTQPSFSASSQQAEPETRNYKGAVYVKGADGEWHLKKTPSTSVPVQQSGPETRTYKGATYEKGADGEWHLQKTPAETASQASPEKPAIAAIQEKPVLAAIQEKQEKPILAASQEKPVITWPTPAPIAYGTVLGAAELNARASVPGRFAYTPAAGEMLAAGTHTITVTFTPADAAGYTTAQATVSLTVTKATPAIAWPTPAPIVYGAAINSTQLNATASVPGKFVYTPGDGEVLAAGVHTLTATFTPADPTDYAAAQAIVSFTVARAKPLITWPAPASITYGTALSSADLNATALVPGKFVYTPGDGEVLAAGVQTLTATFTPDDATNYTTTQAAVSFTVDRAKPLITWPAPASIAYGTALNGAQLNATASVPGTFVYTPAAGEVLSAGLHTLSATFNPASADYTAAQSEVALAVTKVTPIITWPTPASIAYGTALGSTELNATASAPGKFVYIPGAGAVLTAGTHTPSVTFTPEDSANYTPAQAAVSLNVTKATPSVTWPAPASIAYGTELSAAQLNATASIPGKFVYNPGAGEVLAAGTHTLSAIFNPADTTDYAAVQATVRLTVAKAKPTTITWPAPAAISHGVELSAAQLNATASVPGIFAYTPAAGEILPRGTHTLSVTFTPADVNFPEVQATVQLTVTKAMPVITWPAPAPISYGTVLNSTQLNATASVEGTFAYTPAAGEMLAAGTHTLSVTFTPRDSSGDAQAQAITQLTVTKATPIITWPLPAHISYGTPLSAVQLDATALIPGVFVYTPAAGNVIAAGTQTLSVTFTPTDIANYTTAQATVSLVVEALPNIAVLMPETADAEAGRADHGDAKQGAQHNGNAIDQQGKLETRSYKGATYVKGDDGQWYLQKK
jgi:Flp pilus assembly CpaE family ATPase